RKHFQRLVRRSLRCDDHLVDLCAALGRSGSDAGRLTPAARMEPEKLKQQGRRSMRQSNRLWVAAFAGLAGLAVATTPASAQKKYDTGATDTEIKIGNIMPYS